MNLGLRYEYQTPYYERFGDLAVFDPVNARFFKLDEDIDQLHAPDGNNFAPRIGIAWSVTPKRVIRAGGGVFSVSLVARSSRRSNCHRLSSSTHVDLEPIGAGSGRTLFPRTQVRDASGRILLSPNTNVFSIDPEFRTNYTYQWNFGIQRELARDAAGNCLRRQQRAQADWTRPGESGIPDVDPTLPTPVINRRPNPNIGDVSMVKSLDNSNYHALNVKLNKRYSSGFSILGAYTYSKVMGIGGALFGDQSRQQDARNRRSEYAALEFNQTQRLTAAWVYELRSERAVPWGPTSAAPTSIDWRLVVARLLHRAYGLSVDANFERLVECRPAGYESRRPHLRRQSQRRCRTIDRWFDTSCFVNHRLAALATPEMA